MFGVETSDLDQIMDRESFFKKQNKDKIKVMQIDSNQLRPVQSETHFIYNILY